MGRSERNMKVIVSFTTIPSRIRFIEPVIKSLHSQSLVPSEIHIQVPDYSEKEHAPYVIPSFVSKYPRVIIKSHKLDFGSASKWLYPIEYLSKEKDTILVIVDDDCIHDTSCIETLLQKMDGSEGTCFCFSGGIFSRYPEVVSKFCVAETIQSNSLTILKNNEKDCNVDVIQGFGMFALRPYWFDGLNLERIKSPEIFNYSDDILLSGLLRHLDILSVQVHPYHSPKILDHANINPIHGEGRLIKLTLNAVIFLQKEFNIWKDLSCSYLVKRSISLRLIDKIKSLLNHNSRSNF